MKSRSASGSRNRRRPASRQARRGCFERLEERRLLAVGADEQWMVYLLNRARHDPAAYQQEQHLSVDLSSVTPRAPLAVNDQLFASSRFHAAEMAANNYFGHQSQVTGKWPNRMARDQGYPLPYTVPAGGNSYWTLPDDSNQIESLAAGYGTALSALNALIVDEGISPPGHRIHLLGMDDFNALAREIGVGHAYNALSLYRDYWAIHATLASTTAQFLTGVVFNDANGNQRYDQGEGLGGVTVTAGNLTATTNAAGGWSIAVANGTHVVTASGGSFAGSGSVLAVVNGSNVEVDFISGLASGYVDFSLSSQAIVVDDSSAGFNTVGAWTTTSQGLFGQSRISSSTAGSAASVAAWATALAPGLYDLSVTWTAGSNLSQNVVYVVNDGNYNLLGLGYVNQREAPAQFTDLGVGWARLGTFRIAANTILRVLTWNDKTDGQVCAGAVRIMPVAAVTVNDADRGSEDFSTAGSWSASAQGLYGGSKISSSTAGSAASIAAWTAIVQPGLYDVAVTWIAGSGLSQNVVYVVNDGNYNLLGFSYVNQRIAPGQFSDQGVSWHRLGTFQVTTGSLLRVLTWNDKADGQVCADAVRITPVAAITVNDADRGSQDFSISGAWAASSQGLYAGSKTSSSTAGSGASIAAWTAAVQNGTYYQVAVTWIPGSNLSQNVVYGIYDAGYNLLGAVAVNQRNAPADFVDQGAAWKRLGTFKVSTGKTIRVIVWNNQADGQVCADSMRLQPS